MGFATIGQPIFPIFVEGRGKFVNLSQDQATGNISVNSVGTKRTPWFSQSDVSVSHEIKVNKNNESQVLGFEMNVTNLLNQHSVTSFYDGLNSLNSNRSLNPNGQRIFDPGQYATYFSGFNWPQVFNNNFNETPANARPLVLSSWYGQPFTYQVSRSVRFKIRFDF